MHVHLPASSSLPGNSNGSAGTRTPNGSPISSADPSSLTATPLLSLSLSLGAAVHSSPFTGKVSKRPLVASPVDHLDRPVGLPIVSVTSFAVSNDGTRLVWGMRDGSLRFANSAPAGGGRGVAGGVVEQGEVRSLDEAHRPGSAVHLVAFSDLAGTGAGRTIRTEAKQRPEVFVTAAADGTVAVWSLSATHSATGVGAAPGAPANGARERPPPATKLWQARWDGALDSAVPSASTDGMQARLRRVKATAIAFDSGWLGRHHGRPASLAIGRSDGKTVVWPDVKLDEPAAVSSASEEDALVLPAPEAGKAIDTLYLDLAGTASSQTRLALLAHQVESSSFSRYLLDAASCERTAFGHPLTDTLGPLTAFAVDFNDAPPAPSSRPATPAVGKIAFPPRPAGLIQAMSSASITSSNGMPPLSRSSSAMSLPPFQPISHDIGSRFGRRKYVAAGDAHGRVFLWDWEAQMEEAERERGDVIPPAARIQGLEIEGGATASRITALELTEAGVFVGGSVLNATHCLIGTPLIICLQARRYSALLFDSRDLAFASTAGPIVPGPYRSSPPVSHARARSRRGGRRGALARLAHQGEPRSRCRRYRRSRACVEDQQQRSQEERAQGVGRAALCTARAVQG